MKTLKRTAEAIFQRGGFIRKIDNLGPRELPFKISEHGLVHRTGTSFIVKFDVSWIGKFKSRRKLSFINLQVPPPAIQDLREEFGRDVDIIRRHVFKVEEPEKVSCTLHEELLPPAYRKEVIEMINVAKRKQKVKYPHNSGLSYYPFQK